jgi:hypothetical protein
MSIPSDDINDVENTVVTRPHAHNVSVTEPSCKKNDMFSISKAPSSMRRAHRRSSVTDAKSRCVGAMLSTTTLNRSGPRGTWTGGSLLLMLNHFAVVESVWREMLISTVVGAVGPCRDIPVFPGSHDRTEFSLNFPFSSRVPQLPADLNFPQVFRLTACLANAT